MHNYFKFFAWTLNGEIDSLAVGGGKMQYRFNSQIAGITIAIYFLSGLITYSYSREKESPSKDHSVSVKNTEEKRELILSIAREYLETPYSYGGTNSSGFDCSGFTRHIYKKAGIEIPRRSEDQYLALHPVSKPQPGDLVFFRIEGKHISHVGIYAGDGEFIHSPSTGKEVRFSKMNNRYWKEKFAGARTPFQ